MFFLLVKVKYNIKDKNFIVSKKEYIEWKVNNIKALNVGEILKSPNFRIGNLLWYVI